MTRYIPQPGALNEPQHLNRAPSTGRRKQESEMRIQSCRGNQVQHELNTNFPKRFPAGSASSLTFQSSKSDTTLKVIAAATAKSLQLCLTLCNPIDGSPPVSPIPGILQARTLEWVAIFFSNACMHAKSLQSCPTLGNPMDSSPPDSSIHGIL